MACQLSYACQWVDDTSEGASRCVAEPSCEVEVIQVRHLEQNCRPFDF